MLRVLRATAARTSRTSFSFSSARKPSAAFILPTAKVAVESARSFPCDPFLFLRNLSSSRSTQQHDDGHSPSDPELPSSLRPEKTQDSPSRVSSSLIPEAHIDADETLKFHQLKDDSKYKLSSVSASANPDIAEGDINRNLETEFDEDLKLHEDAIHLTDDTESPEFVGREGGVLSASYSADTKQQLKDDFKYEVSVESVSANTDLVEVDGNRNLETEFDEDLELHEDAIHLTDETESPTSVGREDEALSASHSADTNADEDEEDLNSSSDFVGESEEDCNIDMSKVPEELKEMMEDSYECESAEEDFSSEGPTELLTLDEVKHVLEEVRARDVTIFPVQDRCEWTDLMVVATGISDRHVRGIADALVFKIKKKGIVESPLYPTIEGQFGGKWLVVDCGNIVIHVLNEESRAYYRLEDLWTGDIKPSTADEDFETMLKQAGLKDVVP